MFHMPNVLTFNGFVNSHILQVKWRGRLIACRRENDEKNAATTTAKGI